MPPMRKRDELLNEHLFDTLRHARNLVTAWRMISTIIARIQASLA